MKYQSSPHSTDWRPLGFSQESTTRINKVDKRTIFNNSRGLYQQCKIIINQQSLGPTTNNSGGINHYCKLQQKYTAKPNMPGSQSKLHTNKSWKVIIWCSLPGPRYNPELSIHQRTQVWNKNHESICRNCGKSTCLGWKYENLEALKVLHIVVIIALPTGIPYLFPLSSCTVH